MKEPPSSEASAPPSARRPTRAVVYPPRVAFEPPPAPPILAGGEPRTVPLKGEWYTYMRRFLTRRLAQREREHEKDECGRDRRKVVMPRPYLDATSNFAPQISALRVGEAGTITFTVWNDGNYPAWTCYVEIYEAPAATPTPSPIMNYAVVPSSPSTPAKNARSPCPGCACAKAGGWLASSMILCSIHAASPSSGSTTATSPAFTTKIWSSPMPKYAIHHIVLNDAIGVLLGASAAPARTAGAELAANMPIANLGAVGPDLLFWSTGLRDCG